MRRGHAMPFEAAIARQKLLSGTLERGAVEGIAHSDLLHPSTWASPGFQHRLTKLVRAAWEGGVLLRSDAGRYTSAVAAARLALTGSLESARFDAGLLTHALQKGRLPWLDVQVIARQPTGVSLMDLDVSDQRRYRRIVSNAWIGSTESWNSNSAFRALIPAARALLVEHGRAPAAASWAPIPDGLPCRFSPRLARHALRHRQISLLGVREVGMIPSDRTLAQLTEEQRSAFRKFARHTWAGGDSSWRENLTRGIAFARAFHDEVQVGRKQHSAPWPEVGAAKVLDARRPTAFAPPPRMKPTTPSQTLRRLSEDAWSETVEDALRALSRRSGVVGEVATQLTASQLWLEPTPMTVEGLTEWIAARVRTGWGQEAADAMTQALDWHLNTFRGGRKVEVVFRLKSVERMPDPTVRANAAEQPGFSREALALRPDAPHSMGDLNGYASHYFGRTFLADAVGAQRKVELHNGTVLEAIASLRARGFQSFQQLGTPKLHFQILLARHPRTDELRYAIACDDGPDMFGNLEKLLRVASLPPDPMSTAQRIDPSRMSRFDHRPDEATYRYERLKQNYLSSGPIPAQVTVGFKNALLGVLEVRAQRAARLREVQRALKASSEPSVRTDADATRLMALEPPELLASGKLGAWFDGVERTLVERGWAPSPSTPRVKLRTIDGPDAFLDHSRLRYRDADAREREILLTRNPYGEVSLAAGKLFRDSGVTDCFVLGTAAALDPKASVGALHLPASAASARGENTALVNHALDAGLEPDAVHVGSRVVNVRSPVDEFESDIEAFRRAKYDLLEMELAGFARAFAGSDTRVSALQIVSDVPGSGQTLHGFSSHSAAVALENAVDVLVRNFGIRALD